MNAVDEVDQQPRQPPPQRLARRRQDAVVLRHAGQPVDVFGRLVLDDVDHVVHGDDADELVLGVDDGNARAGCTTRPGARPLPDRCRRARCRPRSVMIRLSGRVGRHEQQPAQRDDADEMAPVVHDVEVEDHLDVAGLLERRDRLAGREVLRQGEDVRVHQAAGGLLFVLEQLGHAAARLRAGSARGPRPTAPRAGDRSARPRRRTEAPAAAARSPRRIAGRAAGRPSPARPRSAPPSRACRSSRRGR